MCHRAQQLNVFPEFVQDKIIHEVKVPGAGAAVPARALMSNPRFGAQGSVYDVERQKGKVSTWTYIALTLASFIILVGRGARARGFFSAWGGNVYCV